jgi:hypothetical protein
LKARSFAEEVDLVYQHALTSILSLRERRTQQRQMRETRHTRFLLIANERFLDFASGFARNNET